MGRHTEYNETYQKNTEKYLKSCVKEIPSIEGLAVFLGVARSTIYKWKDEQPDFSDILEKLLAEQAKRLINNGLTGQWNSTITKLILTKHGYSDKVEQDVTSGGKPIPILASMNVSTNDSDNQDSETQEKD
jgi:hypothetical protein